MTLHPYEPPQDPLVRVVDHPLVDHLIAELRSASTPVPRFREVMERMGELLAYEALRSAPTEEVEIATPLETCPARKLSPRVTLVCILRAGAGLTAGMLRLIPEAQMGHVGMFRDEEALKPVSYYDKLPPTIQNGPVLVCDPMLATGGSAIACLSLLKSRGCDNVTFVGVLAAPEGLAKLRDVHPDVPVVVAAVDRQLNDVGYILPGLGDAGDRIFGTL
jgi:uracil phosphoribosyltransferase